MIFIYNVYSILHFLDMYISLVPLLLLGVQVPKWFVWTYLTIYLKFVWCIFSGFNKFLRGAVETFPQPPELKNRHLFVIPFWRYVNFFPEAVKTFPQSPQSFKKSKNQYFFSLLVDLNSSDDFRNLYSLADQHNDDNITRCCVSAIRRKPWSLWKCLEIFLLVSISEVYLPNQTLKKIFSYV